jgi:hypothetical protein
MPLPSVPLPPVAPAPTPALPGIPWSRAAHEQHRQDDEHPHPLPRCSHTHGLSCIAVFSSSSGAYPDVLCDYTPNLPGLAMREDRGIGNTRPWAHHPRYRRGIRRRGHAAHVSGLHGDYGHLSEHGTPERDRSHRRVMNS